MLLSMYDEPHYDIEDDDTGCLKLEQQGSNK